MRDLKEFLDDRELYILEHHPAMSYKAIGEVLGISTERVRQIKVKANHKIRREKQLEQIEIKAQQPVKITIQRKDLWVIIRALHEYELKLLREAFRFKEENRPSHSDLDQALCEPIIQKLKAYL